MRDTWDDYLIDGTDTLKNKFNITSKEALKKKEEESVLTKLVMLHINPIIKSSSAESLKSIHKFLFDEMYYFAGNFRSCTLSKNGYNFVDPESIGTECNEIFNFYNEQLKSVNSVEGLAFVIAPFYYDLIRIHPFREGNGRSIREFMREMVLIKSKDFPFDMELDYTKMDKGNLMLGTKERYFYPSLLEVEFIKGLIPIEKQKTSIK